MGSSRAGVAILVLAAGSSQRMGDDNKLLLPLGGETMLSRALGAATQCCASSVRLLTGFDRHRILAEAKQYAVEEIYNLDFAAGQDKSIAVGLSALAAAKISVLVLLADQPNVSAQLLDELIEAHCADGSRRALIPVFEQSRGTPRILPHSLVTQAAQAQGGLSLRALLSSSQENVHLYQVSDAAVVHDIDTPDDYRRYIES